MVANTGLKSLIRARGGAGRGAGIELEGRQQLCRAPCRGKSCGVLVAVGEKVDAGAGIAGYRSDENAERDPLAQGG